MDNSDLLARIQADTRDLELLDWAYGGEALPVHVADAFDICVRRIEDARQEIERRAIERAVREVQVPP